jgi:hypothetical protein
MMAAVQTAMIAGLPYSRLANAAKDQQAVAGLRSIRHGVGVFDGAIAVLSAIELLQFPIVTAAARTISRSTCGIF